MKYAPGVLLWLAWSALSWAAPSPEKHYIQAEKLLKQGKYAQASKHFHKAYLALGQMKKEADARKQRYLSFGQAEILYRRSQLAWRLKHKRQSCQMYHKALELLPPQWSRLSLKQEAQDRMTRAQKAFSATCSPIPSQVQITGLPAQARFERLDPKSLRWVALSQKPDATGKVEFARSKGPFALKILVKGHAPRVLRFSVARWQLYRRRYVPGARLKAVARAARPKPKPRPKPKALAGQWWFWVAIAGGAAVLAAATVTTAVVLSQPKEHVLGGSDGFRVFGTR